MNEHGNLPFELGYTPPETPSYPTGKRELRFAAVIILLCAVLVDFTLYGGLNLGFAIATVCLILTASLYLRRSGYPLTPYSATLLVLSLIIATSFVRSDDAFIKFVMLCFLAVSAPLGLTIQAGKNRRSPSVFSSLLDAPRTLFLRSVGDLPQSLKGLRMAGKAMGKGSKNRTAVLIGLLAALPLVIILLLLLSSADAAFEGLLSLLPEIEMEEPVAVLVGTLCVAPLIYTLCVSLVQDGSDTVPAKKARTLHPLTIHTVLGAVVGVYVVYLMSQLAYFVGGLSGILPDNYTLAEYARRGFYEMAWLCLLNLLIITISVALSPKKDARAPLLCRIFSLCIGIVSLFFVLTASAKMLLYIDSFGLTRLRVLTEVIMLFFALTTIIICVWLFYPRLAYMKIVLIAALSIGAAVAWIDVDTVVASYNVHAYQQGRLQTIDVSHLRGLSSGAIPYIEELANDADPTVSAKARSYLKYKAAHQETFDIRSLNITQSAARPILNKYKENEMSSWHSDLPEWSK